MDNGHFFDVHLNEREWRTACVIESYVMFFLWLCDGRREGRGREILVFLGAGDNNIFVVRQT